MERSRPRSRGRRAASILLVGMAIAGAAAGTASPATTLPTDTSPCTRAQTRSAFASFIASFDRGAFARLDALFAQEPAFQWFSSPGPGRRLGADARRRSTLIAYLRGRHARGEELRPRAFRFSGNSRRWSNFWFEAVRRADGFEGGRWRVVLGKGAAICEWDTPRLIVLSLGGPPARPTRR